MFDIGLTELLLLGVVALLVIRPEQLPGVARALARFIGRARRGFNAVWHEVEQELGVEEVRRELRNEAIMQDMDGAELEMRKLRTELRAELRSGESQEPEKEDITAAEPPR